MKITTAVVLSIILVAALLVSIISLSFESSTATLVVKIFTLPLNSDHDHQGHEHRSYSAQPDPNSFGLSDTDKFLSYSADGETSYSNQLRMLRCALHLSKTTGRKLLVYPISSKSGDKQFNLSWLQLFNVNWMNSVLNPSHRPCLIRGLNYGEPDSTILDYVYNGTFLNPRKECDENVQDAPWQLRDPSSWSSECYVLPWSLIPHIARTVETPIPLFTSKPEVLFRFPGNELCGKTLLEHEYRHIQSEVDSAILSMDERLVLIEGNLMLNCESTPDSDPPLNVHIESISSLSVSKMPRPFLCMHTGNANLNQLIQTANNIIRSNGVNHTVIITDSNNPVLEQIRSEVIGNIRFGCDRIRFPVCANSADMRNTIEEHICSKADFFLASYRNSFSRRVMYIRNQRDISETRSYLLS